jgi:guanylate kinase
MDLFEFKSLVSTLVICGPSGVGKSTLIGKLQAKFPGEVHLVVSHTTRSPRPGEKDGVDYFFVSREEFEKVDFLERDDFAGNSYGTSRKALATRPEGCAMSVLDLTMDGVIKVKESGIHAHFLAVFPPSKGELEKRLKKRGISDDGLQKRLKEANDLYARAITVEWDWILINDDLDEAYKRMHSFLFGG